MSVKENNVTANIKFQRKGYLEHVSSCTVEALGLGSIGGGTAEPEVDFPRKRVSPLHLGNDGSVLLRRIDLNETSWDLLLFFAELLGFTLCHLGLVEPWGERAGD